MNKKLLSGKEKSHSCDRRSFFKTTGLAAAGVLVSAQAVPGAQKGKPAGLDLPKRTLGRTGLKVAPIGLGTIPLFQASKELFISVVDKCQELGMNYIDLARGYHKGINEEYAGEALKGKRGKFVITTKSTDYTKKIIEDVDKSLKALKTDYIDIYCFHELCQEEQWQTVISPDGAMNALKKAREQGKIRFIGISGHRSDQLTEIIKTGDIDVVILPFNFVFDDALKDLCPETRKRNIGLVGIKPFAGCFLNQHELSLRWILEQPFDLVTAGMWQIDEVIQNARVMHEFSPLTDSEREHLKEERQYWYYQLCRFCYQCKECPQGVPYRSVVMMPLMLRRQGFRVALGDGGKNKYLNEMDKVLKCTNCGFCTETCKYHLPVPELMRNARRTYYEVVKTYGV